MEIYKWYVVSHSDVITPIRIKSETDDMIVDYETSRELFKHDYQESQHYFDTWEEARSFLLLQRMIGIKSAERGIAAQRERCEALLLATQPLIVKEPSAMLCKNCGGSGESWNPPNSVCPCEIHKK